MKNIKNAKSLIELRDALNALSIEEQADVDTSSLPLFGGDPIVSEGFFSWDEKNVLTQGNARGEWVIESRSKYEV